jgi:hypothetical protein
LPGKTKSGLTPAGELLPNILPPEMPADEQPNPEIVAPPERPLTKRAVKRAGRVVAVRETREQGKEQRIGYLARPFVLCGLPFKKPDKTYYRRENGDEVLEITASPEHGLPFGMDYEVLIWVSTLAKKAMLKSGGKC